MEFETQEQVVAGAGESLGADAGAFDGFDGIDGLPTCGDDEDMTSFWASLGATHVAVMTLLLTPCEFAALQQMAEADAAGPEDTLRWLVQTEARRRGITIGTGAEA